MSEPRDLILSPREQDLKVATDKAVEAAGGQGKDRVPTYVSRVQSIVSDWCSPNTKRFIPIDAVVEVEARSHGQPGHPHITRVLCQRAGGVFVPLPKAAASKGTTLQQLAEVTHEHGELVMAVCRSIAGDGLTPPAVAKAIKEIDDLVADAMALRAQLEPLRED